VGQQRLHKAIAQYTSSHIAASSSGSGSGSGSYTVPPIIVEWKPFMIDPGTNKNGETVDAYCRRRWGGAGWTKSMIASGKKDGATFGNWKWWPHTLKAHQLIQFLCSHNPIINKSQYRDNSSSSSSSSSSMSDRVNQALFRAEYEQGENISNIDTLIEIARQLLLQENPNSYTNVAQILDELSTYLTQDLGANQVQQEINTGRQRYGISGVPYFVVGLDNIPQRKPYGLSGAQASATFVELFDELAEAATATATSADG
jgi:predicted DsbA family dithiol-disulfide isomerase